MKQRIFAGAQGELAVQQDSCIENTEEVDETRKVPLTQTLQIVGWGLQE